MLQRVAKALNGAAMRLSVVLHVPGCLSVASSAMAMLSCALAHHGYRNHPSASGLLKTQHRCVYNHKVQGMRCGCFFVTDS